MVDENGRAEGTPSHLLHDFILLHPRLHSLLSHFLYPFFLPHQILGAHFLPTTNFFPWKVINPCCKKSFVEFFALMSRERRRARIPLEHLHHMQLATTGHHHHSAIYSSMALTGTSSLSDGRTFSFRCSSGVHHHYYKIWQTTTKSSVGRRRRRHQ